VSEDKADHAALATIRVECLGMGFLEGLDFHVDGFPTVLSSEYVDLRLTAERYEVRYADMGRKTLVGRSASLAEARELFIDQVTRLAAGRNRGPRAGVREQPVDWRDTMTEEQLIERFKREQRARREARD
jgi:hypothetical protein